MFMNLVSQKPNLNGAFEKKIQEEQTQPCQLEPTCIKLPCQGQSCIGYIELFNSEGELLD